MVLKYALCGDVADKHDLAETDDISGIIETFTVNRSVAGLALFNKEKLKTVRKEQDGIKRHMHCILSDFFAPHEQEHKEKTLDYLAAEYLHRSYRASYDEISSDLFLLQRRVDIALDDRPTDVRTVQIPLFASVPLTKKIGWAHKQDFKDNYHTYKVTIMSKAPPLTIEAKQKAKQARIDFVQGYLNALQEPIIGDWILMNEDRFSKAFEMQMYWIPSAKDLGITVEREEKDPFIIALAFNKKYLVAKWDVTGEEPYEHYLAEYVR